LSPLVSSEDPWHEAHLRLRAMVDNLAQGGPPQDLKRLAQDYAAFAALYLRGITAANLTSLRAQAAARALDLRTPKSALEKFMKNM
jgi:hypothetical protein